MRPLSLTVPSGFKGQFCSFRLKKMSGCDNLTFLNERYLLTLSFLQEAQVALVLLPEQVLPAVQLKDLARYQSALL